MFLSTYENKIDKKRRVSVPASFRSYLSNLGYNGVTCYPSFNNQSIEAWPQDRIEKISNSIDTIQGLISLNFVILNNLALNEFLL